jgi:hypothetical protein
MHVASHDLFNMKLRTCLDTGSFFDQLRCGTMEVGCGGIKKPLNLTE